MLERITPDDAAQLLARNPHNRRVRADKVAGLARDMSRGAWRLAGDPIRVATNGTLIDGQHRLRAIVQAGVAVNMEVLRDMDPSIAAVIDTGLKRTVADVLFMNGEKSAPSVAALIALAWRYMTGRALSTTTPTHSESLDVLARYPDLRSANEFAMSVRYAGCGVLRTSAAAFCVWAYGRAGHEDVARDVVESLATGANLTEDDPVFVLRRQLITNSERSIKLTTQVQQALAIKTINLRLTSGTCKLIVWRRAGKGAEDFPRVMDFHEKWGGRDGK